MSRSPIPIIPLIRPISVVEAFRLMANKGRMKLTIPIAIPEPIFMAMNLMISSLPLRNRIVQG